MGPRDLCHPLSEAQQFTVVRWEKPFIRHQGCLWVVPVALINILTPWKLVSDKCYMPEDLGPVQADLEDWSGDVAPHTARKYRLESDNKKTVIIYDSTKKNK
jgi:hypothetical protein